MHHLSAIVIQFPRLCEYFISLFKPSVSGLTINLYFNELLSMLF